MPRRTIANVDPQATRDQPRGIAHPACSHRCTSRVGVSVWYAYLAKATNDPWIRSFLAEASRGTVGEADRLLRRAGLSEADAHDEAMRLVALSNGATQSVLVAGMDADGAVDLVTREIDRTIGDITGGSE